MLPANRPVAAGTSPRELDILDVGQISQVAACVQPQRARGTLLLSAKPGQSGDGSVLQDLRHSGCLKALFPRGAADRLSAVIVNTSGGITGGDELHVDAQAGSGARLSLTSQAAERIYRSSNGSHGKVRTRITVGDGARVDWLPQETILYDHAALDRQLRVDLSSTARCLLVETLVFGRTAMGETVHQINLSDRIEVRREKVPLFVDRFRLAGDAAACLQRRATARGGVAVASVLLATPGDSPEVTAHAAAIRPMLPTSAGLSVIRPGLLLMRLVAADSYELRRTLLPVLAHLNDGSLPRTWMI